MADINPTECLIKSLNGDNGAYKSFLIWTAQYARNIAKKRFVSWGLNSHEMLEDFVQEILLAVHQKRHTFTPNLPVEPWVSGIIRYKSIDWLRKNMTENKYFSYQDLNSSTGPAMTSEISSPQGSAHYDIQAILSTLNPKQRETLELAKLKGLSIEEISQQTGASVSAVKITIHRAMKSLQKKFGRSQKEVE